MTLLLVWGGKDNVSGLVGRLVVLVGVWMRRKRKRMEMVQDMTIPLLAVAGAEVILGG